ncbi:Protein of unknown function (DUF2752) [Streptomyces sp. Ncost-T6T-1]|nr:Protein of unknown function (DUF2752) [Streptomyces sp. Ncost-T6T-1]
MDASPTPQPPDSDPQGVGPWNMPLTVCPTPDTPARPAFEDGTLGGESPQPNGPSGEGTSQVHGPHGHGSVLKRRTGWKGLGAPLGILAAVTGAFAYVGTVDPNEPGHYPVCPLLKLTGVFCPGCGGLRSAHAFITGDLGAALGANAIATAGYFLFAVVWVLWLVRAWRGKPLRIGLAPAWWWGVGAVLLIFTVVRNLPFGSALAP